MAKYRLAFLTSHPIQYQAPLFRKLAQHPEIDLTVYFASELGLKGGIDPGFGIPVQWDVPLLDGYAFRFVKNYPATWKEFLFKNYDVLVLHGYSEKPNWLAFAAARLKNIPIILHGETTLRKNQNFLFQWVKNNFLRYFFKKVAAFLYVGTRSHEFYKAFNVPEKKLFFSPYSVDNEYFTNQAKLWKPKKQELISQFGIDANKPVVLYLSKFIPRKRPLDLLAAFESIQKDAFLIFVGDGELDKDLKQYARANGVKNVFFAGFKNQSQLAPFYSMADIFVLPSHFETWGLVVNEAMCFGLPILTTHGVSCSDDLVRHGENGFIFAPGDKIALSDFLKTLIDNPEKRQQMGHRSLEMISLWNYEEVIQGIVKAIHFATSRLDGP